jgi:hypothetical protein
LLWPGALKLIGGTIDLVISAGLHRAEYSKILDGHPLENRQSYRTQARDIQRWSVFALPPASSFGIVSHVRGCGYDPSSYLKLDI